MKKLILITLMVFGMTTLMAQNQFRDYVDFKQGQFERNRPQIERKDGKVIIIMTEVQFNQLKQRREMWGKPNFRPHPWGPMFDRPTPMCEKCKRHMKKHNPRKKH